MAAVCQQQSPMCL